MVGMMVVLSPAKKLQLAAASPWASLSRPYYFDQASEVISSLASYDVLGLQQLMKISVKLAELNYQRNQAFVRPWCESSSESCLFMFQGDTYIGLAADQFQSSELEYVNDHLRILSGLYGVLAPRDGIQAYRCEMKTALKVGGVANLTQYWSQPLAQYFDACAPEYLVNCASQEYYAPLKLGLDQLVTSRPHGGIRVIHVDFKEQITTTEGGVAYRTIGLLAKRARGQMARFILTHQLSTPTELLEFKADGYSYHQSLSQFPHRLVFTRHKKANAYD